MANFPGSVKTFTTRNAGDTIQAEHINSIQDEVNAIEAGILNGTAPISVLELTVAKAPPTAIVSRAALQDVSNNNSTRVLFDSQAFTSTSGIHSTTTNPTRLIAPSSGIYLASATITWAAFSTAGVRFAQVTANGSSNVAVTRTRPDLSAGNTTEQNLSAVVRLQAAGYVEVFVTQDSGSTGSLTARAQLVKIR